MIILYCGRRPDLDAIGGSLAYAEYLQCHENKPTKTWIRGTPDGEAQFYLDIFTVTDLATIEEARQADEFQLVDLSLASMLPDFIDPAKVTKVIDHRFLNDVQAEFPMAIVELAPVGAAATQVAEYFMRADLVPTEQSACMLYGAIYSNTLCLKGAITTQRDRDAAEWLKNTSPGCDRFCAAQLAARKKDLIENMDESVTAERKMFAISDGNYGFTQFEMLDGEEFWQENKMHIRKMLGQQPERSLFTIIDLTRNVTLAYTDDKALQQRMKKEFNQEFSDNLMILNPALMRKQIAKILEDK
jgi:inorganic pyrophosphatase/exopolyphosphatase